MGAGTCSWAVRGAFGWLSLAGLWACIGNEGHETTPGSGGDSGGLHAPPDANPAGQGGSNDGSAESGAPNGTSGGAGGAGAEPALRTIVAQVKTLYDGPVSGIKVVINGEELMSDDAGLVETTAPVGPYDAVVFDPGDDGDVSPTVSVWQGLTRDDPTFIIATDPVTSRPHFSFWSSFTITLSGDYPASAGQSVGFWSERAVASNPPSLLLWNDEAPVGEVIGLAWSRDVLERPTAYWYGSQPFAPEANQQAELTLQLEPVDARPLALDIGIAPDLQADLTLDWRGVLTPIQLYRLPAAYVSGTYLVPSPDAVFDPDMRLSLRCSSAEQGGPSSSATTLVEPDAVSVSLDCPPTPRIESEPAHRTMTVFDAPADSCKTFVLYSPDFPYQVLVRTLGSQVELPDFSPGGPSWPAGAEVSWNVFSFGPCSSIDDANDFNRDWGRTSWGSASATAHFSVEP